MRTIILSIVVLFCLSITSVYAQFEVKLTDELFISKISERVFVVTHYFPWESNSLIVKASDSEVVLIDTPYDTSSTTLMLKWIRSNFSPKKITAINTGFHIDNLGGNATLIKEGIDVYGSDLTVQLIDERSQQTQKQVISWLMPDQERYKKAYETMIFTKPNKIFAINNGLQLQIGSVSFNVYYPGESHSPDNLVVYIKEEKLLFGGCMIKSISSKNLGFTGDANLSEWPKSVNKVLDRFSSAQVVIPHHGLWGDISLIHHTINLFGNTSKN